MRTSFVEGTDASSARVHGERLLPDSNDFLYYRGFIADEQADRTFAQLAQLIAWHTERITLFGRHYESPRLVAWYGDAGAVYRYSGITHQPHPWTKELLALRADLEAFLGVRFTSVLLNRYRDGRDSVSWHSDDEPELGARPVIASVSLGVARTFCLRSKRDRARRVSLRLEHGSLLLMRGESQAAWQHAVLKERHVSGERINLTFRVL